MLEYKIVNPNKCKNWNSLIKQLIDADIFYSSNWSSVLEKTYKYKSFYLTVYENKHLISLFPVMECKIFTGKKKGITLPFTDYIKINGINGEITGDYIKRITNLGYTRDWKFLMIHGGNKLDEPFYIQNEYYHHYINLKNKEKEIYNNFNKNTKRSIKKAENYDIKIKFDNTYKSMKKYYKLHCITRKRHGVPPQPFRFFENVWEQIINKDMGFISIAYYRGQAVSAFIIFFFNKKAIYKFGASDIKYSFLRTNYLLMWETIKYLLVKEIDILSFGRTKMTNDGLVQFKSGWGTKVEKIYYYKNEYSKNKKNKKNDYHEDRLKNIFKIMPIFLLKIIGKLFYKFMA